MERTIALSGQTLQAQEITFLCTTKIETALRQRYGGVTERYVKRWGYPSLQT